MTGQYHLCNHAYYVYRVPAEHGEDDMTGQYHLWEHTYYVYLVLANHGEYGMTSQYHLCNHHAPLLHCTQMQRLLPIYHPWPPPIISHHYLASSAPQIHPRRASNPLTTQSRPLKTRQPTPQVHALSTCLSVVTCTSCSTPHRLTHYLDPVIVLDRLVSLRIGSDGLFSPFYLAYGHRTTPPCH